MSGQMQEGNRWKPKRPKEKCDRQENKGDPGAQQPAASRQGK